MISKPPSELEYNEYQRRKRVCGSWKDRGPTESQRRWRLYPLCHSFWNFIWIYETDQRLCFGGFILFNVLYYPWEIVFFIIWYNPLHVYLNFLGMKVIIFLNHRAIGIIGRSSLSLMHMFLFFLAASFPTFRVSEFLSSRALLVFIRVSLAEDMTIDASKCS